MCNCLKKIKALFSQKRLVLLTMFMMVCVGAQAADYYWVGGGTDNDWTTIANWATTEGGTGGDGITQAPGASDTVYIFGDHEIEINSDVEIVYLYVSSTANALPSSFTTKLTGSGSLTIGGASDPVIYISRCSATDDVTGTLEIDLPVTCTGTIDTHSGTTLKVNSGKTLTATGIFHSASGGSPLSKIDIAGTLNVGTGTIALSNGNPGCTQLVVTGNVIAGTIDCGVTTYSNTSSTGTIAITNPIVNEGTITVSDSFIIPAYDNTGTFVPYSGDGTIKLNGSNAKFINNDTTHSITVHELQGLQNSEVNGGGKTTFTTATFSGDITLSGANTFGTFTATGLSDKTLTINADQTIQTSISLSGTSGHPLAVTGNAATGDIKPASIIVSGDYLTLDTDSHVVSSMTASAYAQHSSTTGTGTSNWGVASGTQHIWVGGTAGYETDWNTAANWLPQTVPGDTTDVIINEGAPYPVISSDAEVNSIELNGAAELSVASGASLTIKTGQELSEAITGEGTLILDSGETFTVTGDKSFDINIKNQGTLNVTGDLTLKKNFTDTGTVTQASGKKLIFNGTEDQVFTVKATTQYRNIELTKTSGDFKTSGTLKADSFTATTDVSISEASIETTGDTSFNGTVTSSNSLSVKAANLSFGGAATVKDITIEATTTTSSNITVTGDWTNNGTFMASAGTVTFTTGNADDTYANIDGTGTDSFKNIEIQRNIYIKKDITATGNFTANRKETDSHMGGRNIMFANGKKLTVDGDINLKGEANAAGKRLRLCGINVNNDTWVLECNGSPSIEFVNFKGCASSPTLATINSTDSGGNTGFLFPGQLYKWEGNAASGSKTAWDNPGNWNPKSVPGLGAEVKIEAATNVPTLTTTSGGVTLSNASYTGKITIDTGATLDIADQNVDLGTTGEFINNGHLRLKGTSGQAITAAMSNGTSSVVEYYGGSSTSFIWDGNNNSTDGKQYINLEITGGVTIGETLSVAGTTKIATETGAVYLSATTNSFIGEIILGDTATTTSAGDVTLSAASAVTIADNADAVNLAITCDSITLTKVTTSGTQEYTGTVNGTAIEIENTGTCTFNDNVSATSLSVSGDVEVKCASITTSGTQTYNGQITFGATGGATTLQSKDGSTYKTIKIKKSVNGSYIPVFDSDVEAELSSGESVNTSLAIKGNFNDTGTWTSASGKKLILNGDDDQEFTAGSSTYENVELSKSGGKKVTFKGTPTITNLTEDSNAGDIIFDVAVTIQSDTTFATAGTVSFKNAAFDLSGTKKSVAHTSGPTITNGIIEASDINFGLLSLVGDTTLEPSGSAILDGNVSVSAGATASLTIDGASEINCASITTNGTTTLKGGTVTGTATEINGDLEIGTSAAGITVSIPLTAKGNVTFNGANQIASLTATGLANKTITFEAGKTQTVSGKLTLSGTANADGSRLILKSSTPGSEWTILCQGANNHEISNVDVKDSINISGYTLLAENSWDNGHNTKWAFPGMPYTWVGGDSAGATNWENRDNWNPQSIPGKGAVVTIPVIAGINPNYPKLISTDSIDIDDGDAAKATFGTISVEGTLDLDAYNITAKKIFNKGRIRLKGASGQAITAAMDNTTDTSIVEYYGGSSSDFIWNSNSYKNLEITGAASTSTALSVAGTTKITAGTGAVFLSATTNSFTGEIILGDTTTSTSAGDVTLSAADTVKIAPSANARSLDVTAGTIQIKNIETTAGGQTFTGAVVLAADSTLTAPAANTILFASTSTSATDNKLTGTYKLTTSGAPVQFNGNVSIGTLETDAVIINCDLSITTASGTTFKGDVTETGSHTLSITGPVTIASGCSAITTTGNQSYTGGTFAVNNQCTLSSDDDITFSDSTPLSATQKLIVSAGSTGSIAFNGNVGTLGGYFNELQIQQAATTTFDKTVYITKITDEPAGIVSFNDGGYLQNNFKHTSAQTNLTGTLNVTGSFEAGALTANEAIINTTGTITFNGDVGGTSLQATATGSSIIMNCENINTSGAQIYNSPLTFGTGSAAYRKFTGSTLTFNSTINDAKQLELRSTGAGTTLKGIIGGTTPPVSLTVTGPIFINTGCTAITTSNNQIYKGNTTINEDSTFTSTGTGGGIKFESTSTVSGPKTLTVAAGTNTVAFEGYAGNSSTHLNELKITSAASTSFDNAVYIDNLSDASTHTTGDITFKNGGNITTIGTGDTGIIYTGGKVIVGQSGSSSAVLTLGGNFTHTAGITEVYGTINATEKNIYLANTTGTPVSINCANVILSGNFGSSAGSGTASFGTSSIPTNVQLIPATAANFGNTNDSISVAGNLILSKGTITVKADVNVSKDFLIFGSNYSETDATTSITDEYSYKAQRPSAWSQRQYTTDTLPDGTAISTASTWTSTLKVDSGKSITIGKNFYANGTELSETADSGTWNLKLPDLTSPANGFAEAYHSVVKNCNVTCSDTSDATAAADGSKARLVALECNDASTNSNTNVDFDNFIIEEAYTVRDNAIYVRFNRPVRYHASTLSSLKFNDASSAPTASFTGLYSDPDCQTELNYDTQLTYFYIKAEPRDSSSLGAWNTDATGTEAGLTESTDRSGIHHANKPCLDFPRALQRSGSNPTIAFILTDRWGKRLKNYSKRNDSTGQIPLATAEPAYGTNETAGSETYVLDKTGPVLWTVRTGQEIHEAYNAGTGESSQHSYDSHNFLEFRYSEKVDFVSPSTSSIINITENYRVTDEIGAVQEEITSAHDILSFAGLAKIGSSANTNLLKLYTASTGSSNKYVNALYRKDDYSIRLSIAGYTDGTITDYNGNEYKKWIGYIEEATQFNNQRVTFISPSTNVNNVVQDRSAATNKQIKYAANQTEPVISSTSENLLTAPTPDDYSLWDISEPFFAPLRFSSETRWEPQEYCEAVGNTNGSGSTLDRIEFHFFDNTPKFTFSGSNADEAEWFTEVGWCTPNSEASKDNLYDSSYTYCADIIGGARQFDADATRRTSGGIRLCTKLEIASAFKYSTDKEEEPSKPFDSGLSKIFTTSTTTIFTSSSDPRHTVNDPDGLYIGIGLADTTLPVETTFTFAYNEGNGYMTDLAGNRLRNIVSKTIDRSTPTFDIVISPVNSKEMYITFVKQIITDSAKIKLTDNSGNKIEIADNFMNILPDCFQLITINEDGTYEPSAGTQIDISVPATIIENLSNKNFTTIKLSLTNEVSFDNLKSLYVQVKQNANYPEFSKDPFTSNTDSRVTMIQDALGNYIGMYSAHAISDFAIGLINPLYAYSSDMIYDGEYVMDGLYEEGSWAVHDWNADQKNYGTLPAEHPICVVADSVHSIQADSSTPENYRIYLSETPDAGSVSSQINKDFALNLRIWLPALKDGLLPALALNNNTQFAQSDSKVMESNASETKLSFDVDAETVKSWKSGSQITFLFGIQNSDGTPLRIYSTPYYNFETGHFDFSLSTSIPMFALRLKDRTDITSLDLWSFKIKGITNQRGGVTILNNVINADKGEKTVVKVDVATEGKLNVIVMTLDGNIIKYLNRGTATAGEHYFTWDGRNKNNNPVARGMYFIRVTGSDFDETRKVMVVK